MMRLCQRWAAMMVMWMLTIANAGFAQQPDLFNVASTDVGASAVGTGASFNRDWPAVNAIAPESSKARGTIFGAPMTGGAVEIQLAKPVEIRAIETVGLDYRGTRQAKSIDILIDGKLVKQSELPNTPGKPVRVDLDTHGQSVRIVVTGEHPIRQLPDGKSGPAYGGWRRIAVLSPEDLSPLFATPLSYSVTRNDINITPTQGAVAEGEFRVIGQPRKAEGWPRTLWDKQDIAHYRNMLETSPELRRQFDVLKRAMQERIAKPLGVPQPRKGADGKWLHLPDKEVGPVHNALSLDLANLATVYVLSGEAEHGEFAKQLLLAYAKAYPNYGVGARPGFSHDPSRLFDQRLSDATWLIQVARAYDLIHDLPSITGEERRQIEQELLRPCAEFIAANPSMLRTPTNWSAIATTSILITGYAIDAQDLIDLAMYGVKGTKDKPTGGVLLHFSEKCIDVDGMWAEGSTGYQMMAMEALVTNAEILWRHGVDMYSYRDGALKQLFDSPIRFAYPNLLTPAIHDGGGGSIIGYEANLWEYAYLRYGDPKYLAVVTRAGKNLAAQFQKFPVSVLYDLDTSKPAPPIEPKSFNFHGVGFGITRLTSAAGTVSLLLDYGPNRSHGHPDKLSIDLYAFDGRLIPDPGSVWYEQPLYKNWYATTVAHNTLVVNEADQKPAGATQVVYGLGNSVSLQRATTDEAYVGVTMDRALFLTNEYMADLFGAFSNVPRKLDLAWHFMGSLETTLPMSDYAFPSPAKPGYSALTEVKHATTDQPWRATVQAKNGVARFFAAGGVPTEVIAGNGYMRAERPPTLLQRRADSTATVYGNAVDFSGGDDSYVQSVSTSGDLERGYAAMEVRTTRGTDLCFVAYRPGTYGFADAKTDAQQAFIARDGDAIRTMYLAGGTTLSLGANAIWRSETGLAYIEKSDNGAFVVGNPSNAAATVSVSISGLNPTEVYVIDNAGQRVRSAEIRREEGRLALQMAAGERVELATTGVPSIHDVRQAMLQKREAAQREAERAEADAAKARSQKRAADAAAKPLPKNTTIVVQAEDFSAQGGGQVSVLDTKTAAVGRSLSRWDTNGQWTEWKVQSPADGFYNLSVCYCSTQAASRTISVNGEVQEPTAPLEAASTDGFSNGSDDWALAQPIDPVSESPLLIRLRQGENTVRLTNSDGRSMNLDYLVFSSPDFKPTRIRP